MLIKTPLCFSCSRLGPYLTAVLLLLLQGCQRSEQEPPRWQEIQGRDRKEMIYRARVPEGWSRKDPPPGETLTDTTKPLVEYGIAEGDKTIRITIHNFPVDKVSDRIPPAAQISRWKGQFSFLDPTTVVVTPHSHGGYSGLLLEASGTLNGKTSAMMGWSMQLHPEHYRILMAMKSEETRQMAGDYTIKAVGDQDLMIKYRQLITDFANTFELIKEIPSRR